MKTIREIALDVAHEFILDAAGQENVQTFAEDVLSAYLAQQEPVEAVLLEDMVDSHDKSYGSGLFATCNCVTNVFLAPPIKPGFVMVPVEPTKEMIDKVIDERLSALVTGKDHTFIDIYKAMLAASQENKNG